MNKIQLVGRLTKDPELNFLPGNGTAIAKFTIAVNRPRLDKTKPQEADFINCVCFGKRAESIANYVKKGHLFGCSGRLQITKYVDKKDGTNKWSTDVLIEDFEFLQSKGNNNTNPNSAPVSQNNQTDNDYMEPVDEGDIPF